MAKPNRRRKEPDLGPIARYERGLALADQQSALEVVTPEQRAKGTYEGDGRRIVNRGGTPVARWLRDGKLTETQHLAIAHCWRLWELVGLNPRTTASYGERMAGQANEERRAVTLIEAREDLYRIQGYIPKAYWDCFENVCRFDEPAGIAGSKMGFGGRSGIERAHTVVCFVADLIAMREGFVPVTFIRVSNAKE